MESIFSSLKVLTLITILPFVFNPPAANAQGLTIQQIKQIGKYIGGGLLTGASGYVGNQVMKQIWSYREPGTGQVVQATICYDTQGKSWFC